MRIGRALSFWDAMEKSEHKSCANCRHLSRSEGIIFSETLREERVICLKKNWRRGSVMVKTIFHDPSQFRMRAETCKEYQTESSDYRMDSLDKETKP